MGAKFDARARAPRPVSPHQLRPTQVVAADVAVIMQKNLGEEPKSLLLRALLRVLLLT